MRFPSPPSPPMTPTMSAWVTRTPSLRLGRWGARNREADHVSLHRRLDATDQLHPRLVVSGDQVAGLVTDATRRPAKPGSTDRLLGELKSGVGDRSGSCWCSVSAISGLARGRRGVRVSGRGVFGRPGLRPGRAAAGRACCWWARAAASGRAGERADPVERVGVAVVPGPARWEVECPAACVAGQASGDAE